MSIWPFSHTHPAPGVVPEGEPETAVEPVATTAPPAPEAPETPIMATAPVVPAPKPESGLQKFEGFLVTVGKQFLKGLEFAVKYAPDVAKLVGILIPAAAPESLAASAALTLIQNAIIEVEQKYAASGVQSGTGAQKSAEVITLVGAAVTQLLTDAGVKNPTTAYIQSLVTAVVSILNASGAVPTA